MMSYTNYEIADSIIKYRAKHGLTQKQFAEKAGVSVVTVLQIEKGTTRPTNLTRAKIELAMENENESK